MTVSRWKLIASALVLGTGGIAVFAMPPSDKSKPLPAPTQNTTAVAELPSLLPVPKAGGADTKASPKPTSNPAEFDLLVPTLPTLPSLPAKAKTEATETGPSPIKPVKFEPIPEPVKGTEDKPMLPSLPGATGDKSTPTKTEPTTPTLPPLEPIPPVKPVDNKEPVKLPNTTTPTLPETLPPPLKGVEPMLPSFPDTPAPPMPLKPLPPVDVPKVPEAKPLDPVLPPVKNPVPPTKQTDPFTPPIEPPLPMKSVDKVPLPPSDITPPVTGFDTPKVGGDIKPIEATTKHDLSKLKMLVRLDAGSPRFEIRNSSIDELLLKVSGNKIEMQNTETKSTLVGVSSSGNVKFSGPGIEGTCDQLTIISATGEVMMKGNVKLKSKHGRNWSEITSDKMVYQIGAAGLVPAKTTGTLTGVEKQR